MACGALASLSRMRRGPCGPEFLTGGRVSQPWSRRRSSSLRHSWSFNLPFARVQSNRSEEHTSELQSRLHLVCRLLLEKKNKHRRLPQDVNHPAPCMSQLSPPNRSPCVLLSTPTLHPLRVPVAIALLHALRCRDIPRPH